MPNPPSLDISSILITEGLVKTPNQTGSLPIVTIGFESEQKGLICSLWDTGGPEPNPAWQRDYPRVQVRVKGDVNGYADAWKLQQDIKDVLLGRPREVIADTLYVGFWMQGDIASLGTDRDNRPILVSNYRLVREYDAEHR